MSSPPLSPAAPRRLLHQRTVQCDGYLRDDGHWEIEARLLDTKTYALVHFARGALEPGAVVHDMALRITVDDDFAITAIEGEMAMTPMLACQDVRNVLPALIGVRFIAGWRNAVRERIGVQHGCVHLMDLLTPAATTLYQTAGMGKEPDGRNALDHTYAHHSRPFFLDRCHGWRLDGSGVRDFLPEYAVSPEEEPGGQD